MENARNKLYGNIEAIFDEKDMTKATIFIPAKTLNTPATTFRLWNINSYIHIDADTASVLSLLLSKEETTVYYPVGEQMYKAEMHGNKIMQINEATGMQREIQYNFLERDVKTWFEMHDPQSKPGIYLEVRFSSDFPNQPPFVFVHEPRFEQYTAHVTVDGAICAEFLTVGDTPGVWRSTLTFKQFVDHLFHYTLLDVSNPKNILRVDHRRGYAYTEAEARRSFQVQASWHATKGWNV